MTEFSYLVLYLPRGMSRDAARRILTDHAEYGNWELSRLRLYPDGSRKATLRRLIIRQVRGSQARRDLLPHLASLTYSYGYPPPARAPRHETT
jgi:hypothetical protein